MKKHEGVDAQYKEKLIALCKGLEIQYIDELIEKDPDDLFHLGKLMADIFKISQDV